MFTSKSLSSLPKTSSIVSSSTNTILAPIFVYQCYRVVTKGRMGMWGLGLGHVGLGHVRLGHVRFGHVRGGHVRLGHVRLGHVRLGHVGRGDSGT